MCHRCHRNRLKMSRGVTRLPQEPLKMSASLLVVPPAFNFGLRAGVQAAMEMEDIGARDYHRGC